MMLNPYHIDVNININTVKIINTTIFLECRNVYKRRYHKVFELLFLSQCEFQSFSNLHASAFVRNKNSKYSGVINVLSLCCNEELASAN